MDSFGRVLEKSRSRSRSRSRDRDRRSSRKSKKDDKPEGIMSFKEFSLNEPDDITPTEAIANYEKYKKEYMTVTAKKFFDAHHGEEWLQEMYDPNNDMSKLREAIKAKTATAGESATKHTEIVKTYATDKLALFTQCMEKGVLLFSPFEVAVSAEGEEMIKTLGSACTMSEIPSTVRKEEIITMFATNKDSTTTNTDTDTDTAPQTTTNTTTKTTPPLFTVFTKPSPQNHFTRDAYIISSNADETKTLCASLDDLKPAPAFRVRVRVSDGPIVPYMDEKYVEEESRVELDLKQALKVVDKLDSEMGIDQTLFTEEKFLAQENKKQLSWLLSYLRVVHAYCYYTCTQYVTLDELVSTSIPTTPAAEWSVTLDTSTLALLQRTLPTPEASSTTMDALTIQKLEEFYAENIVMKSESKYRCLVCSKLFKGKDFVRKHITTKHNDNVDVIIANCAKERYFNNYLQDENRPCMLADPNKSRKHNKNSSRGSTRKRDRDSGRDTTDSKRGSVKDEKSNDVRDKTGYKGYEQQYGKLPANGKNTPGKSPKAPPVPSALNGRTVITYEEVSYKDVDAIKDDDIDFDYGFGDEIENEPEAKKQKV